MALTGKVGQIKYYLFKLLKKIIKKRINITYSFKGTYEKRSKTYDEYLIQEKLLVKILNECFNLNVDTALIVTAFKREWLLKKGGIKK